jgi:hypothetical protein
MLIRILLLVMLPCLLKAQHQVRIRVVSDPIAHTVTVTAGGKPLTTFIYPDSLEKPSLYPIYAPDGQLVTRGFPLKPRPGEPTDHPHHFGLWFNYENVNGLDFWNNSYAIPAENRSRYGRIHTDSVSTDGSNLLYTAHWIDQAKRPLLLERTTFHFTATATEWIIDRSTTLTALVDTGVSFPDAKDGVLGLRVTKELQIPSNTPGEFIDDKGNITKVAAGHTPDINGNYLTSEGKTGDSAWGTRARWCMMYGKKGDDTLSIAMIDNSHNPGYPTYWHARGYGLFAANPLGQKIFSNGTKTLNFHLANGQSATFQYRIIIAAGKRRLSTDRIEHLTDEATELPVKEVKNAGHSSQKP